MYLCQKCGPFVKFYKEIWTQESNGPFKIEFIHFVEGNPVTVDEIEINARPEGELIGYSFCGRCNQLIDREQAASWEDNLTHVQLKANE